MDNVLVPYLTADDEREREQHLDELLMRHAAPLIRHVLRRKFGVYVSGQGINKNNPGCGGVTQVMEAEISDPGFPLCLVETKLHVDKATFGPRTRKDVLACTRQSFQHSANRLIDGNETIFSVLGNSNVNQSS